MTAEQTNTSRTETQSPADAVPDGPVYRPLADVVETAEGVSLMLEVPGAAIEDVDISLDQHVLTIRAGAASAGPEGAELVRGEYGEGRYERAFSLSDEFDPEGIGAGMRNGVLTITLPRAAQKQPRKIAVRAG